MGLDNRGDLLSGVVRDRVEVIGASLFVAMSVPRGGAGHTRLGR